MKQDDFLNEHETLAHKQLLEKQQAERQAPDPPKSKPADNGLQARYVWNAERQQEVEESLRRDGMMLQNDQPRPQRNSKTREGRPSRRPVPLGINSGEIGGISPLRIQFENRPGPETSNGRGNQPRKPFERNDQPRKLSEENSQLRKPFDTNDQLNKLFKRNDVLRKPFERSSLLRTSFEGNDRSNTPGGPTGFVDRSLAKAPREVASKPRLTNDKYPMSFNDFASQSLVRRVSDSNYPIGGYGSQPRANLDNKIDSSRVSNEKSDWGLLARKQSAKESNSEDFWAAMRGTAQSTNRPARALEQSGKTSGTKDPWAAIRGSVTPPPNSQGLNDWGKEFDKKPEYRRTDQPQRSSTGDLSKTAQVLPETAFGTYGQGQTSFSQDRSRDRDRSRRVDRFEGRGGGGRGKRSGWGSRYNNDDDEGGFDYDEYQEKRRLKAQRKAQRESDRTAPQSILLPELISITALAEALKVQPSKFLTQLGELGFEGVSLDSLMAGETAALVAQEYGFEPTVEAGVDRDLKPRPPPEDLTSLPERPPVVTIMGHVDHGKTTLLDYLRESSIAAQEHGGITQRIGAFSVKLSSGKQITFLDTPGHAAFLTMRQRGAYVTDIVVLVVAADDSVKPQTIEAIKHARSAKVPMIVAINKIDKDGARIDQVKHDLAREGVEIEDFGGDVQVVCVSGKTGEGMDDLEENILTLSEILDHRAEVDGAAEGWILESSLKLIGKTATVLVKRGTLRPGDYIAAGLTWAKIRHLRNEAGVEIDEAPPGTPVEILGWKDLPAAGDQVLQAPDEGRAKDAVEYREGLAEREKDAAAQEIISEARRALQEKRAREKAASAAGSGATAPDEAPLPEEENGTRMVNFVVKGDLHGSVEAVCAAILELGNHEVRPRILRSTAGAIHEFDVEHAATSKSVIVNFATTTPGYIKRMAEEQGVTILDHNVIYHLVDDVKKNLSAYLAPEVSSRVLGEAEVLQVFPINVKGRQYRNIAGCRVRNGLVGRSNLFRVYRGGEKVYDGMFFFLSSSLFYSPLSFSIAFLHSFIFSVM